MERLSLILHLFYINFYISICLINYSHKSEDTFFDLLNILNSTTLFQQKAFYLIFNFGRCLPPLTSMALMKLAQGGGRIPNRSRSAVGTGLLRGGGEMTRCENSQVLGFQGFRVLWFWGSRVLGFQGTVKNIYITSL